MMKVIMINMMKIITIIINSDDDSYHSLIILLMEISINGKHNNYTSFSNIKQTNDNFHSKKNVYYFKKC